ncbi:MAG: phospholipid carrier-dependent glycosyltransferase, partial [Jaaginema sp. PMC 1080.18]|nr:phospholipid carrier-dependent glycosyltransferase [Jaaginema sp. PMC 1080.18]
MILGSFWLLSIIRDRLWIYLDRGIPAWDQTHHLTGTLNYYQALQHPAFFSSEWWQNLWMLSSKNPPLTYILGAGVQSIFGRGPDQALWIMPLFSAILMGVVYALGNHLFQRPVGLFAAIICLVIPGLYPYTLQFLLDYPLTTTIVAGFTGLIFWQDAKTPQKQWLWAAFWGICLGCAFMIKQGALFFLCFPLIIVNSNYLRHRCWRRIAQSAIAFTLAGIILIPWYQTNWIFFIGNYQQGIVGAGAKEGDPTWQTLAGWWYYPSRLPGVVTFPLLVVALGGGLLALWYWYKKRQISVNFPRGLKNAGLYLLPAYIIATIFPNKDIRYIMPAFPFLAILLAWGLSLWPQKWRSLRWGTIGILSGLMLLNLFPIGLQSLANTPFYPDTRSPVPHTEIVQSIIEKTPHLQATVGVMPSTPQLNHNNFNYYGALADFQVYGREVGVRDRYLAQDLQALDWYLTKTGDLGAIGDIQLRTIQQIENSPDLTLHHTWELADTSLVKLYQRQNPPIQIELNASPESDRLGLKNIIIPPSAPPGQ